MSCTMRLLMLETVEPSLDERVISAVAPAAHRTDPAKHLELVLKREADVLAAAIGV